MMLYRHVNDESEEFGRLRKSLLALLDIEKRRREMSYKELAISDLSKRYSISENAISTILKINDILKFSGFIDDNVLASVKTLLTDEVISMVTDETCRIEIGEGEYQCMDGLEHRNWYAMDILAKYVNNELKINEKALNQIKAIIGKHVRNASATWKKKVWSRAIEIKELFNK